MSDADSNPVRRLLRGIVTVGGWTMISRVLGFVRDMIIAAFLGAGPIADAFFVALKLPNLFRRLFGEGAFNAAFVPEFSGLLATEGPGAARRFAREAFGAMTFWLLFVTLLGEAVMPGVIHVLAPGFVATPEKFELAVTLTRITFPYLLFICLGALVSGILNGMERYASAAASYVLFNIILILCMVWLTPYTPTVGHALAWGVTISGVAQFGLLLYAVHRAGMGLAFPKPTVSPRVRLLLRRMAPGLVGAGVTQLNLAVDVVVASPVKNNVSLPSPVLTLALARLLSVRRLKPRPSQRSEVTLELSWGAVPSRRLRPVASRGALVRSRETSSN